jgi:hypothetical protein
MGRLLHCLLRGKLHGIELGDAEFGEDFLLIFDASGHLTKVAILLGSPPLVLEYAPLGIGDFLRPFSNFFWFDT